MCHVCGEAKEVDVVLPCDVDEITRKMRAVTIVHEDDGLAFVGVRLGLWNEELEEPLLADIVVHPSRWRCPYADI